MARTPGDPCGAAEAGDLVAAWEGALAGDPVSAYGGVVAVKGVVDRALAERLAGLFLEVVVACAFDTDALAILSRKTDLRLLEDPGIVGMPVAGVEYRSAGGAVLATDADVSVDLRRPGARSARGRRPSRSCGPRPRLRVCRHVPRTRSSGQGRPGVAWVQADEPRSIAPGSRSTRQAPTLDGRGSHRCFFPFPTRTCVCRVGGDAFAHPGGSKRDAEVIAAADAAGAAILLTGVRHFRH